MCPQLIQDAREMQRVTKTGGSVPGGGDEWGTILDLEDISEFYQVTIVVINLRHIDNEGIRGFEYQSDKNRAEHNP